MVRNDDWNWLFVVRDGAVVGDGVSDSLVGSEYHDWLLMDSVVSLTFTMVDNHGSVVMSGNSMNSLVVRCFVRGDRVMSCLMVRGLVMDNLVMGCLMAR